MAARRGGLVSNPLTASRRLPPVIPDEAPDAGATDAADDQAPRPGRVTPAPRGPVPSDSARDDGVERYDGSWARTGPMSNEPGAIKKAWTHRFDLELIEEAKDAFEATRNHHEGPLTISGMAEEAMRREVIRLQDEFNDGKPFPHRRGSGKALTRGGNTRGR